MSSAKERLPAYYIPHGGGPWPFMMEEFGGRPAWEPLIAHLEQIGEVARKRAKALLVISAHWEEALPTVHFGTVPGMLYDYYGFPEHTYRLRWPAPGAPEVARRADGLLRGAGIETGREEERGYDHGTFVPMMVALPEAKIPVAQLSLVAGLDPQTHYAVGRALAPLRDEGVLIVGSGFSYHNLRMFNDPRAIPVSERFDEWLRAAAEAPDPGERARRLVDWESAPGARACHPRSEHLVPIFIAAGAGGADPGRAVFSGPVMGVRTSGFAFGA
ncbi:MAG TPA: class III extradiol ring-cleavage dioxygenase [Desulfobacterales bacterium]|nr:class III extradiol ring-cleavage dioxygenase [Desulfobacterales bacterium]